MVVQKFSKGEKIFDVFNFIIMILLCASTLYPFIYLVSMSLSTSSINVSISLIPKEITFDYYLRVFKNDLIISGYINTIIRTVSGTLLSLIATFAMAYPLSKKYFLYRNFWTAIIVFTMFFDGGLIPSYILIKNLHLYDTMWSLILPGLVSAFNLIIVRNFMMGIPDSLEESAKIDGANEVQILVRIILPMCKPILATLALWILVGHWNAWFDCMIYIKSVKKQVVQLIMRSIVMQGSSQYADMSSSSADSKAVISPEGLKAATIMVTTIPILAVYPFVQKYFVKGVMIGAIKG